MSQLFLNIFKEAQLDDASCHSLRRTFITELAHKGINVRVLQQLAGHQPSQLHRVTLTTTTSS